MQLDLGLHFLDLTACGRHDARLNLPGKQSCGCGGWQKPQCGWEC